jgi:hypothetical protein
MPILIGLAVAGIVVAVSYLVPLIVTCVIAGVAIVVTFVTTRYYYKSEETSNEEANDLKKQQINRDNALHDEASKIVLQAGIDLQTLLKLSKEQQLELKKAIIEFTKNIEDSDIAATNLTKVSDSIQSSVTDTSIITKNLAKELESMKSELMIVNNKLKLTEENLAKKEQELHEIITKLTLTEKDISKLEKNPDLEAKINPIDLTYAQDKNDELLYLREKNIGLSNTIEKLKTSIVHLKDQLQLTTESEQLQLDEIQKLIAENRTLTTTIEKLVCTMEERQKYQPTLNHEKNRPNTTFGLFQA